MTWKKYSKGAIVAFRRNPDMNRKPWSSIFAAVLLGSAVLGLGAQQPAPAPKAISFAALKGPSGIGLIRLFDASPALPGATVQMLAVASADLMAAKVISGDYDVAVLPLNMAAKLRNAGVPIVLAAIVGEGMVSFLTSDPSIRSLGDLRGKEVYVAGQGATPDYLMQKLLSKAGLDPSKDLRLSYSLPYPEMAASLALGKIQYAVLPEPFATLAISANPALKAPLDLGALWKSATGQASYPMTALVVSARLAAERPEAVKALLAAVADSIARVKAQPAAAGLLVEKNDLGLKAAVAEKAIPRSAYVFVRAPAARPSVEALLKVFLDTAPASIGGKLPEDAFYAAF
jgi:NitT/TauT family transport system substrate-binding protein